MASSNKTTNYQLSQWAAADQVRREDFNMDNQRIDTALKNLDTAIKSVSTAQSAGPKIAIGSYTGDGTYGADAPNQLTFDFTPKFVFIMESSGSIYDRLIAFRGMTSAKGYGSFVDSSYDSTHVITWGTNSITWYNRRGEGYQFNVEQWVYYYLAIG